MNWKELKDKIYYWDDSWRDIYVLGTSLTDWEKWVNFVNTNYKINWFNGKVGSSEKQIDFEVIKEHFNGNNDLCSTATVFIDKIQVKTHFFAEFEIENDIDPREFNSIEDHDRLVKYMSEISLLLNKEVILTPENEYEVFLFKIGKTGIVFS